MADKGKGAKEEKKAEKPKEEKKGPVVKPKAKSLIKKKRWLSIIAPKMFNEMEIGESYLADPDKAIGRKVDVSMMTLTGEPKKQNIHLKFRITRREGEKLFTELIEYKVIPSALKKMTRRGKDRIVDSLTVTTSDKKLVKIKPIMTTFGKAKGGVLRTLRKHIRASLPVIVARMSCEELFREVLMSKFQRNLADSVRKIYPITYSEIKWMYIMPGEAKHAPKAEETGKPAVERSEKEVPAAPAKETPESNPEKQ